MSRKFLVVSILINGSEHTRAEDREITADDLIEGDIASYNNKRRQALDIVNHWNYLATITNTENGVWHYYLI